MQQCETCFPWIKLVQLWVEHLLFKCSDSAATIFKVTAALKELKGVESGVVILNKTEAKDLQKSSQINWLFSVVLE